MLMFICFVALLSVTTAQPINNWKQAYHQCNLEKEDHYLDNVISCVGGEEAAHFLYYRISNPEWALDPEHCHNLTGYCFCDEETYSSSNDLVIKGIFEYKVKSSYQFYTIHDDFYVIGYRPFDTRDCKGNFVVSDFSITKVIPKRQIPLSITHIKNNIVKIRYQDCTIKYNFDNKELVEISEEEEERDKEESFTTWRDYSFIPHNLYPFISSQKPDNSPKSINLMALGIALYTQSLDFNEQYDGLITLHESLIPLFNQLPYTLREKASSFLTNPLNADCHIRDVLPVE